MAEPTEQEAADKRLAAVATDFFLEERPDWRTADPDILAAAMLEKVREYFPRLALAPTRTELIARLAVERLKSPQ